MSSDSLCLIFSRPSVSDWHSTPAGVQKMTYFLVSSAPLITMQTDDMGGGQAGGKTNRVNYSISDIGKVI